MVSVAAPDAKGSAQTTQLGDTSLERIIRTGDEISRNHGKIRFKFIGHAHRTAHVGCGHITADVNVAELRDAQAIELSRQSADRQFDRMNTIIVPADEKAVGSRSERKRSRQCAGARSEEHTSLQSHLNLVCRLLLEKKKKNQTRSERQNEPSASHTSSI